MNTKVRLLQLGKKQADLLAELHKRGFEKLSPPLLSNIINRRVNTPQAFKIRELCDKILDEWEEEKNV